MWLSRMMSVGRPFVSRKTSTACSMRSRSLASPTRRTFQPYARNRVATSSVKARLVCPSIVRSEEHTSELQSRLHLVCRLLLEKKKKHSDVTERVRQLCDAQLLPLSLP